MVLLCGSGLDCVKLDDRPAKARVGTNARSNLRDKPQESHAAYSEYLIISEEEDSFR